MKLTFNRNDLLFKRPAGTSRGILTGKPTWFVSLHHEGVVGQGEVSLIPGLSLDDENMVEGHLLSVQKSFAAPGVLERFVALYHDVAELPSLAGYKKLLGTIATFLDYLKVSEDGTFPAIRFGLEMAILDLLSGGKEIWFQSDFLTGDQKIPVNGLIWMGEESFMQEQIEVKLAEGYTCLKLKIGAIDFASECRLLKNIRKHFTPEQLELRVDANGAFSPDVAPEKLEVLSQFVLHSIEQPIKQGQWSEMAALCDNPRLPIALDEELIGVAACDMDKLLAVIKPQYIILKPSLLGGFYYADKWIEAAEKVGVGVWVTSALESNVGLNGIAQWVSLYDFTLPQGLGTGKLFTNNVPSQLVVEEGFLRLLPC